VPISSAPLFKTSRLHTRQRIEPSTYTSGAQTTKQRQSTSSTATYVFVHGAALTPSDLARREETKRFALSLGHTPSTWKAAGHIYHDYADAYEVTPYVPVMPPPPPRVVEASAPRQRPETAPAGSDGLFLAGTRAG
jgi:hypothetical protein